MSLLIVFGELDVMEGYFTFLVIYLADLLISIKLFMSFLIGNFCNFLSGLRANQLDLPLFFCPQKLHQIVCDPFQFKAGWIK